MKMRTDNIPVIPIICSDWRVCHETLGEMTKIRKCSCKRLAKARYDYYSESKEVSVGVVLVVVVIFTCRFTAMDMTGHF